TPNPVLAKSTGGDREDPHPRSSGRCRTLERVECVPHCSTYPRYGGPLKGKQSRNGLLRYATRHDGVRSTLRQFCGILDGSAVTLAEVSSMLRRLAFIASYASSSIWS